MRERDVSDPADILLVEDNPGDVRLTEEAFESGQVATRLHVVADGIEALDFLFRREEYGDAPQLDFVLLDLNLPRMDGHEVLKELRADPELQRLPVVVLTSSREEADVRKSYELGANSYLTKPVDPDEFIDTILTSARYWLSVVRLPDGTDCD